MTKKTEQYLDIWSRPGRWAKQRAYMFLLVNLLVYYALNTFLFWMHSNKLTDFSFSSYRSAFFRKTLIDFLTFPIGANEAPILVIIVGLLIAVVVAVPILIAQLYGFRFSLLFIAGVFLLAHLPSLSLFLLVSCFIAIGGKYRYKFKFGVVLLGLIPILLYFYLITRGVETIKLRSIEPSLLYISLIIAFISATVISASVLTVAYLFKYRPGGILISMIPFFVVPIILFDEYIGRDQLEFRMIVYKYLPTKSNLRPVDISMETFSYTLKEWRRYRICDFNLFTDIARSQFPLIARNCVQTHQVKTIQACNNFLRKYPKSDYRPNVLYIKALAEDLRFDHTVLLKNWLVEYQTDFVSPQSEDTWKEILNNFPETIYAQPARLRLSILAIRNKNIEKALILLWNLLDHADVFQEKSENQPEVSEVLSKPLIFISTIFRKVKKLDIPQISADKITDQAQELLELIQYNSYDLRFGNAPLAELLRLDPHHPSYRNHLIELSVRYSGSKLHDNLLTLYALTEPDPEKCKNLLLRYAKLFDGKDAQIRILYELGRLAESKALVEMNTKLFEEAENYYQMMLDKFPNSIFADRVLEHLHKISKLKGRIYGNE